MARESWDVDGATRYVKNRVIKFVTLACIEVKRRAKELLSIPGTAYATGHKGPESRGKRKGQRIEGAVRSKPGEPPRKQTGRLRSSVTHEVDHETGAGRVGTNVRYGKALELGTKRGLLPRPWLRRALAEMTTKVRKLLDMIKE